ncbi:unnamed protein product [Peniophora sp. CBMAI 1063]|nr:unnamed protein product [Peniophora sp. CBMAI 1063]
MTSETKPTLEPLSHLPLGPLSLLPVELWTEVAILAQLIWHHGASSSHHDPHAAVERLQISSESSVPRAEPCCELVPRRRLPYCCRVHTSQVERSPAHCLIQTNHFFRDLIFKRLPWLWEFDNVLFKKIAGYSGREHIPRDNPEEGHMVLYGARSLIVTRACTCLLRVMRPLYDVLKVVKIAMPWDAPLIPNSRAETFFLNNPAVAPSPLEHFDLELFDSPRAPVGIIVRCITRENLSTFRGVNVAFCFSSNQLTSMYISFPHSRRARFGASFTNGLVMCASRLEYLTLDAGNGEIVGARVLRLPKLRFLRVVLPITVCAKLLSRMDLPAQLDIHLEPVVQWRSQAARRVKKFFKSPHQCEAPLAELDAEADSLDTHHLPCALWRFACALAAPDQTRSIFQDIADFDIRQENLWDTLQTASFEIRQDPSHQGCEREPLRFPELVGVVFTNSVEDMRVLQERPGLDWRRSSKPGEKHVARRSFVVRDGVSSAQDRNALYRATYVKPFYDVIAYVTSVIIQGQPGTPYEGKRDIASLVIPKGSFIPRFSLGWRHLLVACNTIVELVIHHSHLGDQHQQSSTVATRYIIPTELTALAVYLNDVPGPGQVPCPHLRCIRVVCCTAAVWGSALERTWGRLLNTKHRVDAGAVGIQVILTSM